MMTCSPNETYWGWKLVDPSPEEAKILGACGDYLAEGVDHEDAEKVLDALSKKGLLNARQAIEAAKDAFGGGISPAFPPDVNIEGFTRDLLENDAPDERRRNQTSWSKVFVGDEDKGSGICANYPNRGRDTICTYTDGGVKDPKNKWLATAGFGIWSPGVTDLEEGSGGEVELTHKSNDAGGLRQWASLPGQRCSSTRVEIAGGVVSLLRNKAIHIGTDSAAMLHKARKLQVAAENWVERVKKNWLPKKSPFGKPWGCR